MTATVSAVSQSQSLAAIRNFIRASISCITYARGLCSDSSYESRRFLGMDLKHMVPASTEAITISEWIEKGAFDALNRNYLKEMALCVHNADCTEQLESYCFSFTYTADGQRACMSVNSTQQHGTQTETNVCATQPDAVPCCIRTRRCSKEEVQQALSGILSHLLEVVEGLPPLMCQRVVTMRLTYYEAVTPENYEPPHFAPASSRMVKFYRDELKHSVSVGSMDTSHHLFSVSVRQPLLAHIRDSALEYSKRHKGHTIGDSAEWTQTSGATLPTEISSTEASSMTAGTTVPSKPRTEKVPPVSETEPSTAQNKRAPVHRSSQGREGARPHSELRVEDLASFSLSLQQMASKKGSLRATEVAYLLLVAFVFSRCSPGLGGRTRITSAELHDFLQQSCPLSIALDDAIAALQKLVADGFLTPQHTDEPACKVRRVSTEDSDIGAGAIAPDGVDGAGKRTQHCTEGGYSNTVATLEWSMAADPPSCLLAALLSHRQVTDLLPPSSRAALVELQRVVSRRSHKDLGSAKVAETGQRRRKDTRGQRASRSDNRAAAGSIVKA